MRKAKCLTKLNEVLEDGMNTLGFTLSEVSVLTQITSPEVPISATLMLMLCQYSKLLPATPFALTELDSKTML